MRTLDDELTLREKQRREYFENPKYQFWILVKGFKNS